MSEPVRALNGATWSDGIADVAEAPLQGMITLRGDLNTPPLRAAATQVTGAAMPGQGQASFADTGGLCWMSPDELLVLVDYAQVQAHLATMTDLLGSAHALAANVSDARASFVVSGAYAREVMAKLVPVDLSRDAFGPGMFRRTRMAQVAAAFWMPDPDSVRIICFRSQAQYVFDLLKTAAAPDSAVNYLTQPPTS
ncbi:MAG: sarcosine oxidase subunit gamma family protein [Pseudomonadota bacterium]